MIKVRSKVPSQHKHKCHKQSCSGVENPHQNYLSATSRNASPNISKKKSHSKNTKNNKKKSSSVHHILQQSYLQLKDQNQQLHKKLNSKKKKVQQLKQKLKSCEVRLAIMQREDKLHDKSRQDEERPSLNKKYSEIITASQNLAKQTLERYRLLQDQHIKYKEGVQKQIAKLMKEKDHLIVNGNKEHNKKDGEVEELRRELKRLRQEQLTASSMKNISAHFQNTERDRTSQLSRQNLQLKQTVDHLKLQVRRLQNHNDNLESELKTYGLVSKGREDQLRANLDLISQKVSNWEEQYKQIQQTSIEWEFRYNRLYDKYEKKKLKLRSNNEEWSFIFKELIIEIDKLKGQLQNVSTKNLKLLKMCNSDGLF